MLKDRIGGLMFTLARFAIALMVVIAFAAPSAAQNWPQFRGSRAGVD
jgi:hypothetical protein